MAKPWSNLANHEGSSSYPQINTVLKVYETIHGPVITKEQIYGNLDHSFKTLGLSLGDFDNTLWNAVTQTNANTIYDRVYKAGQYLFRKYLQLQDKIKEIEAILLDLTTLANSDLFWDPIEKNRKKSSPNTLTFMISPLIIRSS